MGYDHHNHQSYLSKLVHGALAANAPAIKSMMRNTIFHGYRTLLPSYDSSSLSSLTTHTSDSIDDTTMTDDDTTMMIDNDDHNNHNDNDTRKQPQQQEQQWCLMDDYLLKLPINSDDYSSGLVSKMVSGAFQRNVSARLKRLLDTGRPRSALTTTTTTATTDNEAIDDIDMDEGYHNENYHCNDNNHYSDDIDNSCFSSKRRCYDGDYDDLSSWSIGPNNNKRARHVY